MTTPERSVEEIVQIFQHEYGQYTSLGALSIASDWLRTTLHQELQKAREEERERIIKKLEDNNYFNVRETLNPPFHSELDQGPDAFERQGL